MKRNAGIDIIVPVYNALEDLKKCIESILRHTDLSVDRIVLIDDQSTDQNVYPYLKSIEQAGIVVLQNPQNQGFSGSVNRGLQYSDRDVLLLNTDTIVTARWIDKIVACAYSDPAIGTVTPFSNNATLCSIPNFCEENTVPYGLTIDEYAQVIERCSMKKYPRITVAVGFCMFIKREVIDRVGLFDGETFKKGYGEENDFCWRAEQLGYYHVLCDDTYIFHSGTASFLSDEKRKLAAEHEKILSKRYPEQIQENAQYILDNPHQYLRTNVDFHAKLKNGKRNILYVLHTDFRADANSNIGGTQFHVKDLMMNLRRDNNVFVLARDGEILRLTVYLEHEQITLKFRIGKKANFQQFRSKEIAKVYRQILTAFSIDLVHVHHVMDLSFDIFTVAREMGIRLLLTLHDYYYICPTIKLLKDGSTYCGGCGENCMACLHKQLGYAEQISYISVWQEECRRVLGMCDALIAPSAAAKDVYAKIYPDAAKRIQVIPHGIDFFMQEPGELLPDSSPGFAFQIEHAFEKDYIISGWAYQEDRDSAVSEIYVSVEDSDGKRGKYRAKTLNRPDLEVSKTGGKYLYCGFSVQIPDGYFASGELKLQLLIQNNGEEFHGEAVSVNGYVKREKKRRRIAFLGGMNEEKGSRIAYEMMKQGGSPYDWYIIGGIRDPNLYTLDRSNVFKTDWYVRENVCSILKQNQIDLVCILSIWPETFCYTLSEAELAGVPVLAANFGALGERLRQEKTGWLVEPDTPPKEILKTLDQIFAEPLQFKQVSDNAARFRHKSIGEMREEYDQLYRSFPSPQGRPAEFDAQAIYNAYVMGQAAQGDHEAGTDAELIRRINELEASILTINSSPEYKMVKFFNRENFPFRRQFKWLIGFAYSTYVKFFKRR